MSYFSKERDEQFGVREVCRFSDLGDREFGWHVGNYVIAVAPEEGDFFGGGCEVEHNTEPTIGVPSRYAGFIEAVFDGGFGVVLLDVCGDWIGIDAQRLSRHLAGRDELFDERVSDLLKEAVIAVTKETGESFDREGMRRIKTAFHGDAGIVSEFHYEVGQSRQGFEGLIDEGPEQGRSRDRIASGSCMVMVERGSVEVVEEQLVFPERVEIEKVLSREPDFLAAFDTGHSMLPPIS